jgi:AraC-like DNA-binding protein
LQSARRLAYSNIDIKLFLGRYLVNVLNISYEPPVSGWGYDHHNHSSYEFHYIPQGNGLLEVNGRTYNILPGTVYLTGPGVYHKQRADKSHPMSEYSINLELKPHPHRAPTHNLHRDDEVDEMMRLLTDTPFWFGQDHSGALRIFEELLQELSHRYIGRFTLFQSIINQLMIKTVRNFMNNVEVASPLPQKVFDDRRRTIVDSYFNKFAMKSPSPGDLARQIGVSIRQLNRIFLDYYSMTFKQKLTSYRIEQAKDLLMHTELPVKEISQRVGYLSESYFCKVFKESLGMTPLEYRHRFAASLKSAALRAQRPRGKSENRET